MQKYAWPAGESTSRTRLFVLNISNIILNSSYFGNLSTNFFSTDYFLFLHNPVGFSSFNLHQIMAA
jgi:hypothetical protein